MSTVAIGVASGVVEVNPVIINLTPEPTYYKCKENPKYDVFQYDSSTVPAAFCAKLPNNPSRTVTQHEKIIPVCPYQPEFMKREAVFKKLRKEGMVKYPFDIEFVGLTEYHKK
jgi:hypothetical protein